jgi:Tol biopolymer transport system component
MRATSIRIGVASVAGLVLCTVTAETLAAHPSRAPETIPARSTQAWRIALTSNREGDSDIYSMNADGSHVRRLTHARGYDGAGAFSPDGRKLLYYRNQSGVWVMNADGSGKRNLTSNSSFNAASAWSPDGRKILFTSNRDGNNEVYVMNADGSGQRNLLTSPSSQEWAGRWSPDGSTIFFTTDRDGNWEIYAMDADGRNPRNLSRSPRSDGDVPGGGGLALSPDGRRIAFASTRDTRDQDNPELYVMNADGSGVQRVTHSPGIESLLSWSPDGRKLAAARIPSKPRWAFYVMNVDGSGVRKIDWSLPRGG